MNDLVDLKFFVPGLPSTAGSKKAFPIHTGTFVPNKKTGRPQEVIRTIVTDAAGKKGKEWKGLVIEACRSVWCQAPLLGPLRVTMTFFLPRPKKHYRTGKLAHVLRPDAPKFVETKPDLLKLMRGTEDALTGIMWRDDAQIVQMGNPEKIYTEETPGCMIRVTRPLTLRI